MFAMDIGVARKLAAGGLFAVLAGWMALAAPARAQEDATYDADELVEMFDEAFARRKWPRVATAVVRMERVLEEQGGEAKRKILPVLQRALGVLDEDASFVAVRAAEALGKAGEEGAETLQRLLRNRKITRSDELRDLHIAAVKSLGSLGLEEPLGVVLEYLEHRDPRLRAAAAVGLRSYAGAPGEVRKKITGELIDALERALRTRDRPGNRGGGPGRRSPSGRSFRNKSSGENDFAIVGPPVLDTLTALTGERMKSAQWKDWWAENRKADWD